MTIGRKLTIGFAGMALLTLVLSYFSLSAIGSLGGSLDMAISQNAKKLDLVGGIETDLAKLRIAQRGVIMYTYAHDTAHVETNKKLFEATKSDMTEKLESIRPLLRTQQSQDAANAIGTALAKYFSAYTDIAKLCDAGNPIGALDIARTVGKYGDEMEKRAAELGTQQRVFLAEAAAQGAFTTSKARWTAAVFILLSLAIGAATITIVYRVNRTLRTITSELSSGSQQIASASTQVSSSSQSLAQGSSEQAASLEETSASTEEITSMTRKNAENSRSAASVMTTVDQHVRQGNQTLEQMVVSMHEITASSDKISKIIKVIDEIAFQTNILALNAAVEAARAGEAGMGFAVVADEVRNLAQRSAQAAKDTAALIEESIAKSNEGSSKLQQVTEVIRAITESSAQVKTLVDEVNVGSQEQARGIEQISKAVAQMDQVTQSTAANAEESASASEELSAQAEALNQIVMQLRTMVGGQEVAPAPQGSSNRGMSVRPIKTAADYLK
jgi:methyl-accepting chemotaxis protein